MGTSGSHPSPRTPSWAIAAGILGSSAAPPSRQSQELWRAAAGDENASLAEGLAHPLIAEACRLAALADTPSRAVSQFEDAAIAAQASGLFFDMAKRALARAVLTHGGSPRFSEELFSELVSYYASSDLSGLVGARGRISTVSEAIELKEQLRTIARATAARAGPPPTEPLKWALHVQHILADLQVREGK